MIEKIDNVFENNEDNLGKNSFAGPTQDVQKQKPNEDLVWMRGVESGLIMMDQDLKEIQEGEYFEKKRQIDQKEKEIFWQRLASLNNQDINEENVGDILAIAKIGECLRGELINDIEEKSANEMELKNQIAALEEKREKIRKNHWTRLIPISDIAYIFRPKEKLREVNQEIRKQKDDLYILSSRKQKDKESLEKINEFYQKNTPEKLFAAKAKKEIGKTIEGALKSIEQKYGGKIESDNQILWDLTRQNFKKEILANVANSLLDKKWEDDYRKILEEAIKEKVKKIDQEKIVYNKKNYSFDPQKWLSQDSDIFLSDYDDYGVRKVADWDWKNYRGVFDNAPMIREIIDGLAIKITRKLMEDEFVFHPQQTKEILNRIIEPEKILPYLFLGIKHNWLEGNGYKTKTHLDFLTEIKADLKNKSNFYHAIKQETSVLKVADRKIAYSDGGGDLKVKWNQGDEFTNQDAERLKLFFDPSSMFNHLRGKINGKNDNDPDLTFLVADKRWVQRQEKYSRLLLQKNITADLEKNIKTEKDLAGFYHDEISSLDRFANRIFSLAENKDEGDRIFQDFKDDLSKRMSFGEATLKGWNTISENTNLAKEQIWQIFFDGLKTKKSFPFDPQIVGRELDIFSKMAAAGYCQERILLDKFEEQLLEVANWDNVLGIFKMVKIMPGLEKETVQSFFHKVYDGINHQRPFVSFEDWVKQLDEMINMTAIDKDGLPNWEIDVKEFEESKDITQYQQMIYKKFISSLVCKIDQTQSNARENAQMLSEKSGVSLEKIYAWLLSLENDVRLENNQIFQNLLAEENEQFLIKFIGEISGWKEDKSENRLTDEEINEKIKIFLTKCPKKNKKSILSEMVNLSRMKNREKNIGQTMIAWIINSAGREKNFNPNKLSTIVSMLSVCKRLHWNTEFLPLGPEYEKLLNERKMAVMTLDLKEFNWQNMSDNIIEQMREFLGREKDEVRNSLTQEFLYCPLVNKKIYQEIFGNDIITTFLNCLPKSPDRREQSDPKKEALNRGKYDRVTPWLQLISNYSAGLTLTETSWKYCGEFIKKYGLNEERLWFETYRDLWLKDNNMADKNVLERINTTGLQSLKDLEESKKKIEDGLIGDKFELDFTKLNNFEKSMLDIILGLSSHSHNQGKLSLEEVIDNFLLEKDNIRDLTEKYKIFSYDVKKLGEAAEMPAEDKEKYLNIISQIKEFRKTDWRKIWSGMVGKMTGKELTQDEFERIDNRQTLMDLLKLITENKTEFTYKYEALIKRIIWNTVLKKDFPTEEMASQRLKALGNPENIEQAESLLINNVLEHAIIGHIEDGSEGKNSLGEIWGEELATIMSRPETQKWLVEIFAPEKNLLAELRTKRDRIKKLSEITEIKFVPGRDFLGSVAAYIGDACYSKKVQYMSSYDGIKGPLVMPYRIIVNREIVGSVLIFELKDEKGENDAMLVRAFNIPKHAKDFDMNELIENFLNELEPIAKEKGYRKIVVPGKSQSGSISNSEVIKNIFINTYTKEENKIELKQEFDFNGYPLKNDCYVAREIKI
ncbi:MAG: hypothetical protein ACOZAR_02425 [Patescibacteria group bacterium]